MRLVYLDINIGDAAQHQRETAEYEQSCELLRSCESYGFKSAFADMTDDELGSFAEFAAASYPNVTLRMSKPASLLVGRLVFELFDEDAPKACENFRALVDGDRGLGKVSGKPLHYLNAPFHRIIPGFMAQGGDIVFGYGSGKETVFGKPTFNDDKGGLKRKFDSRGLLAMANSGKNSSFLHLRAIRICGAELCGCLQAIRVSFSSRSARRRS
jgi:hypothetical protein